MLSGKLHMDPHPCRIWVKRVSFKALTHQAADAADEFISSINWDRFGLAGFSICLCQLTSLLYSMDLHCIFLIGNKL